MVPECLFFPGLQGLYLSPVRSGLQYEMRLSSAVSEFLFFPGLQGLYLSPVRSDLQYEMDLYPAELGDDSLRF